MTKITKINKQTNKQIDKQIKQSMLIEHNIKKTKFFNRKKELVGYYGDGKKLHTIYEK
jgi:hypothetical protein